MKKFLVALSATALILSSSGVYAGGLNDAIEDPVVKKGPASSIPLIALLPLGLCLIACFQDGGNTGSTSDDTVTR